MLPRPLLLLAAALALTPAAGAQTGTGSPLRTVAITATKLASIGITLPQGGSLALPGSLSIGINDFSPLPVTTSWRVDPSQTARVSVVAYFDTPARALATASGAIPARMVFGRVPTGGAKTFAAFTQGSLVAGGAMVGTAGGSLLLLSESIGAGNAIGERTDQLQVRIDLTGSPPLPAGTYTGRLNLVAVTQ